MQAYPRIHRETQGSAHDERLTPADRERRDRDLMIALRDGSTAALEELMAVYWGPLVRWAARELGDEDLARDLIQETFVQVWQRRSRWASRGSPRAYLFCIMRNLLIDERRKRKVRSRWLLRSRRNEPRLPATPEDDLDAVRLWEAYQRALDKLPERRREAFLLVYIRGLSHAEVAEVMQVSPQTVANQIVSAVRQLREDLDPLIDGNT